MRKEKTTRGEESSSDSLVYNLQTRRKMNPLYIVFTPKGLLLAVTAYVVIFKFGGGMLWWVVFLFIAGWIHKNHFNYSFYEVEKLPYTIKIVSFLKDRRKRHLKSRPINYDFSKPPRKDWPDSV